MNFFVYIEFTLPAYRGAAWLVFRNVNKVVGVATLKLTDLLDLVSKVVNIVLNKIKLPQ